MVGEQDQRLFPTFHVVKDPPILFPFMINSSVDHIQGQGSYGDQHLRQHVLTECAQQFTDHMKMSRSSDVLVPRPSPLIRPIIQSIDGDMIQQRSAYDPYDIGNKRTTDGSTTSGWAVVAPPEKMAIMRKATSEFHEGGAARKPRRRAQAHQDENQKQQQQQQLAMGVVRVCSDCSTTKTPLWRSGPCGPKSLCNACGIRQRKARRAMAAAAAAASNGGAPQQLEGVTTQPKQQPKKEKRVDVVDRSLPFKKRCKMVVADHADKAALPAVVAASASDLRDDDHVSGSDMVAADAATMSLQSKVVDLATPLAMSSFHTFPADEITDAAMLLMTLSCGLVHS